MSTEVIYPHILKRKGEPARLARTPRIRVAQLAADYLAYGWSAEEMCRQHAYLSPAEAHAAMSYHFDHEDEIHAEIDAEIKETRDARAKATPTSLELRLKAKGSF